MFLWGASEQDPTLFTLSLSHINIRHVFFLVFIFCPTSSLKPHFIPPREGGGGEVKQDRESRFEFEGCMKYFPPCRCTLNKSEQKFHYPFLTSCTHVRSACVISARWAHSSRCLCLVRTVCSLMCTFESISEWRLCCIKTMWSIHEWKIPVKDAR